MAGDQFFNIGSVVNKRGGVLAALKHNKRTLQAERGAPLNIDVTRTPLNYCLAGDSTPSQIATHAKAQMLYAGIETPRKNGVMAVEVVFSLPTNRHDQDTKPFFTDCLAWVSKTLPGELLSFDVHLDESAPHAHALILPLIDNKMQGDKIKGDRTNIQKLRELFYKEVGAKHQLNRGKYRYLTTFHKHIIAKQVFARLTSDSVRKSSVWQWVADLINKDPLPLAQQLGIDVNALTKQPQDYPKVVKSFVDHKRSKGKGTFIK